MYESNFAIQKNSRCSSPRPEGGTCSALTYLGALGNVVMAYLLNGCGELEFAPPLSKSQQVVLLLKFGKPRVAIEYFRTVSLASCVGMVTERLIHYRLQW